MKIDHERLIRVLEIGNFGGVITQDEYYVKVQYNGFAILLRPEEYRIDFWVQTHIAYVAVPLPHPGTYNAFISKAIRWVFGQLKRELSQSVSLYKINLLPMEGAQQTFGQKAVGLSFNPSGEDAVGKCKQGFADLIDQMNDLRANSTSQDQKRHASVAITEIEGAQMRAVKALTWKD